MSDHWVAVRNLDNFRSLFESHIHAVDSATKLTQNTSDSQLKRAKEVLNTFDAFRQALRDYGFGEV